MGEHQERSVAGHTAASLHTWVQKRCREQVAARGTDADLVSRSDVYLGSTGDKPTSRAHRGFGLPVTAADVGGLLAPEPGCG